MRKLWNDSIPIHDTTVFEQIGRTVRGAKNYSDRALVLPVPAAVVRKGVDPEYLAYLRRPDVDIGARSVIEVEGRTLYEGLLAVDEERGWTGRTTSAHVEFLQKHVQRGGFIEFFCMTPDAERFIERAMIPESRVLTAPLEITRKLSDKAQFRTICQELNLGHLLLEYEVLSKPEEAVVKATEMLRRPSKGAAAERHPWAMDFVVVKQVDLAGGDGMLFLDREDDVTAKLGAYFAEFPGKPAIVEAGFNLTPYSTQMIMDADGRMHYRGPTRQLVVRGRHLGNIVVRRLDRDRMPKGLTWEQAVTMETATKRLAEYARSRIVTWRGTIGFDLGVVERTGDVVLHECNGRQTASTYPLAVMAQLEGRVSELGTKPHERPNWGVVMYNSVPTGARDFSELKRQLGEMLFAGTYGVLPTNVRLMSLEPQPACGFIAVGRDLDEAVWLSQEAQLRMAA